MTYISNDCLAWFVYKNRKQQNDSPFIGSLFESDEQYLTFCEKFDHYISLELVFGKPKLYFTDMGSKKQVTTFLGDIEIHWPHENDEKEVLDKYKRRLKRVNNSIFLWSDMQMFNGFREDFRERFKKIPNSRFIEYTEIEAFKDKSIDEIGDGVLKIVKWFDYNILASHI